MQKREDTDAAHSGLPASASNHNTTSSGFQISAKRRDTLKKLAKWRIDKSSMQKRENSDASHSGLPASASNHNTASSGFQPSAKLGDKLKKLAKWRIDKSSIDFLKQAPEFRGGYATVSRALLVTRSGVQDRVDQPDHTGNKGLKGKTSRQRMVGIQQPLKSFTVASSGSSVPSPQCVAVKKMNLSDDRARILGLTLREAEFLVDLSHENIIKLVGFVEDLSEDTIWLVLPWADNGTLRDFIASVDWEIPERISLIHDVTRGVEYLHTRQPPICHGDLKSINVLVNAEFRAVITDFGSARRITTEDLDNERNKAEKQPQAAPFEASFCASNNTITLTGNYYTLRWATPELLAEGETSLESDIWALGWVAYEVMTNSIPFQDVVQTTIVIVRVVRGDLPSITDHARMSLIQALCSLMLACWSTNPQKRPTAKDCRMIINWMPKIIPNPIGTTETAATRARTPGLLLRLGDMYRRQSDYSNALDCFTNAVGGYRDLGMKKETAMALVQLAQVHRCRNEYSQAITLYSEALEICTDIGDTEERADILFGLAEVHRFRDEYSQAITLYSEALQIRTDLGDRLGSANVLSCLAEVHRHRNEYSQAVTFYSKALEILTEIGYNLGRANALWGLGQVHQFQKEYSQAVTFYSEDLQIRTDIGDTQGRAQTLRSLAEVHRLQKEYSRAIELNSEALEITTDIGDRYGRAYTLLNLADVHCDQGHYSDAIGPYTEAAEIFEQIGLPRDSVYASNQAAKVLHLSRRDLEEAT